jgi:RNA polymerase sigma-32 factor
MASYPVNFPPRTVPRLTPEQERELALRWRDERDEAARDRIVSAHLDLIRGVLSRLKGADLPREDLFQDGVIGLMKAVDRFDPEEGVRFATYATYWVRAEIQSSMGLGTGPVRVPRSHESNKVATWFYRVRARVESDVALGLCPLPADGIEREAARRMGVCPDQISSLLGMAQPRGLPIRSQSVEGDEDEGGVLLFSDLTPEMSLGERERQALFAQAIKEACAGLPDRDREVIERRYLREEPETFQAIAEGFGLTRERIRQIEVRALRSIQKKLRDHRGIRRLVAEAPD